MKELDNSKLNYKKKKIELKLVGDFVLISILNLILGFSWNLIKFCGTNYLFKRNDETIFSTIPIISIIGLLFGILLKVNLFLLACSLHFNTSKI